MNANTAPETTATAAPVPVDFPAELCDSPAEWGELFLFECSDWEALDYEIAAWFEYGGAEPDDDFMHETTEPAPTPRYALVAAVGTRAVYREIDRPTVGYIVQPETPHTWPGTSYCYTKSEPGDVDDLRREIGDPTVSADDDEE